MLFRDEVRMSRRIVAISRSVSIFLAVEYIQEDCRRRLRLLYEDMEDLDEESLALLLRMMEQR
jgi:hypothetical protein